MKIFDKNSIVFAFVLSFVFVLTAPSALFADDNLVPVNIGTAGNFVILSKTGISTTGTTSVFGDIGVSPAASSYITGFGLSLSAGGPYSTSAIVSGKVYAPDYATPAPSNLTTAVLDMQTAYTDAMGRAPNVTELGAGNIGGLTVSPGVYKWSSGVTIPSDVTLSGDANDIWIFQIAQTLNVSSGAKIVLAGGAQASNIFWVVAGQTTLGTTSIFNGILLDQTAIVLNTGARLNGRALAQTAVTLDSNTIIMPAAAVIVPTPAPTPTPTPTPSPTPNPTPSPSGPLSPSTPSIFIKAGCVSTSGFSSTTGLPCAINPVPIPMPVPGCVTNFGFSPTTGQSCANGAPVFSAPGVLTYNFGNVTLKNGSRGAAVMELQKFLNRFLNLGLAIDGKLGPKTIAVIKKWQMENGLVADGLIGAKTKARMNLQAGAGN